MARFFYLKLNCDHESNDIFSVNLSLTVVVIEILFLKFLSFVNMEYNNEISSSEDEFDFSLLNNEITSIHKEINESNDKHGDEIRGIESEK